MCKSLFVIVPTRGCSLMSVKEVFLNLSNMMEPLVKIYLMVLMFFKLTGYNLVFEGFAWIYVMTYRLF